MDETGITITKAKKEDLPILAEILFSADLGKKYYPTLDTLLTLMMKSFETDAFFILYHNLELVGFIWFQNEGAFHTFTYLHMLYVKKEYRKKGYGKKLLDFLENASLDSDGSKKLQSKIFLVAGEWNQSAINFYECQGYKKIAIIPGLFRKKLNEQLMMKECFRIG